MILQRGEKPLLLRAFEIAHGGQCASTRLIARQLKLEGYPEKEIAAHLRGKSLRTQLAGLLRDANDTETPAA